MNFQTKNQSRFIRPAGLGATHVELTSINIVLHQSVDIMGEIGQFEDVDIEEVVTRGGIEIISDMLKSAKDTFSDDCYDFSDDNVEMMEIQRRLETEIRKLPVSRCASFILLRRSSPVRFMSDSTMLRRWGERLGTRLTGPPWNRSWIPGPE